MMVPTNANDDIKLHLQEADDLKKKWFSYVFDSIQKLYDKIETNAIQLHKEKEEILKLLIEYKNDLNESIQDTNTKNRSELERLKNALDLTIDAIEKQLNGMNLDNSHFKHTVDKEFSSLKIDFMNSIDTSLKEHIKADDEKFTAINGTLKVLNDSNLTTNTKLGIYVVIVSFIVTTIITAVAGSALILFKDAIKLYFLGV